jgi:hypothetical protein
MIGMAFNSDNGPWQLQAEQFNCGPNSESEGSVTGQIAFFFVLLIFSVYYCHGSKLEAKE